MFVIRLVIELISRFIGYYIFFSAFNGAAHGDILNFFALFALADVFLIGGALIGSGERWNKPTFTTTGGAIVGWIFFILIAPFIYLVRDILWIGKLIITLPFRRGRRGSGGSGGRSRPSSGSSGISAGNSSNYGRNRSRGGESVFNRVVKNLCTRYSGHDYVGKATRVDYTFSHYIFSHSITLTVDMVFTVTSSQIYSEYDATNERNSIDNYISSFDVSSIQSDIASELEELREKYDDLDDAWGIHINGNTDIKTV